MRGGGSALHGRAVAGKAGKVGMTRAFSRTNPDRFIHLSFFI